MESKFSVLQLTTAILREGGSVVQHVYDEKFSNQDQLNIGGSCGDSIWKPLK